MAIIAIDGPAGAGKSSVSREVARRLGFSYLDTGAMYRCAALAAHRKGVDLDDVDGLALLLDGLSIEFKGGRVLLNGEDVSEAIRTPEMDKMASAISSMKVVRKRLTALQREIGRSGDIVAEGRDMGTVVFPDADLKIFLTASPEARARRRWKQLQDAGREASLENIIAEIEKRDRADSSRAIAPLRRAADAVLVDSTVLSKEETVAAIVELARERIPVI